MKKLLNTHNVIAMIFAFAVLSIIIIHFDSLISSSTIQPCDKNSNLWIPSVHAIKQNLVILQTDDLKALRPGDRYKIETSYLDVNIKLVEINQSDAHFIYTETANTQDGLVSKETFRCKYVVSMSSSQNPKTDVNVAKFLSGLDESWKVQHAVLIEGRKNQFTLSSIEQYTILVSTEYHEKTKNFLPYEVQIDITEYGLEEDAIEAYNSLTATSATYRTITTKPHLSVKFSRYLNYCFKAFQPGCSFIAHSDRIVAQVEIFPLDKANSVPDSGGWENLILTIEENVEMFK